MDLVLELKNNASKLLLAIMESRGDSENAERILYNMNPKQLVSHQVNIDLLTFWGKVMFWGVLWELSTNKPLIGTQTNFNLCTNRILLK